MRNHTLQRTRRRKNHSIWSRAAARICSNCVQDRKLVIWSAAREREAFVVIVDVRVLAGADLLVGHQIIAALGHGRVNGGLVVASRAAKFDALALWDGD